MSQLGAHSSGKALLSQDSADGLILAGVESGMLVKQKYSKRKPCSLGRGRQWALVLCPHPPGTVPTLARLSQMTLHPQEAQRPTVEIQVLLPLGRQQECGIIVKPELSDSTQKPSPQPLWSSVPQPPSPPRAHRRTTAP